MRRILAFDLAGRIGYAWGDLGAKPDYGAHQLPATGDKIGAYIEAFVSFLHSGNSPHFLWQFGAVDLVIFEAPVLPRVTKLITVRKLTSLAAVLEWQCDRAGIECREVALQSVKLFWTGKGNAKKPDMTAAARRYGYAGIEDHNHEDEADALAAWWYAVDALRPGVASKFNIGWK